jgi:hypothetical protein
VIVVEVADSIEASVSTDVTTDVEVEVLVTVLVDDFDVVVVVTPGNFYFIKTCAAIGRVTYC